MSNTFIRTRSGSQERVYIMEPWETHTLLAADLVDNRSSDMVRRRGDDLIIFCANGTARYHLSQADRTGFYVGELGRSTYEVPPHHVRRGMN